MVLVYALLAPTTAEAKEIQRSPYEWHMGRLAALSAPQPDGATWDALRSTADPLAMSDAEYEALCEISLFVGDPDSFCEKLAVLRDAGVRQIVPWMGAGGVAQEHVLRSMRLLKEVMPRFT
jgi:hypothetical protein